MAVSQQHTLNEPLITARETHTGIPSWLFVTAVTMPIPFHGSHDVIIATGGVAPTGQPTFQLLQLDAALCEQAEVGIEQLGGLARCQHTTVALGQCQISGCIRQLDI